MKNNKETSKAISKSNSTKNDITNLTNSKAELRTDRQGDDEQLENRVRPVDFTAKGLDVPGRNTVKQGNTTKLKDEENQHYSLGSEHNNHLETSINKP